MVEDAAKVDLEAAATVLDGGGVCHGVVEDALLWQWEGRGILWKEAGELSVEMIKLRIAFPKAPCPYGALDFDAVDGVRFGILADFRCADEYILDDFGHFALRTVRDGRQQKGTERRKHGAGVMTWDNVI